MCQLLGMNCATPTDFSFSFRGFCQRGGTTDIHSHGWGLAIYEGRGLRTFLDTEPASTSPVAELVSVYPIKTYNMMAHVRYATQGEVSLENVHPFSRELWGIHWTFCHNGEVPKFSSDMNQHPLLGNTQPSDVSYNPVGDTDSEAVFCAILNSLKAEFKDLPTLPVLHKFIKKVCDEIVAGHDSDTIFNFLLGCGQYTLFAYSWPGRRPGSKVWNGLWYIIREPPFSTAQLVDCDYSIDFAQVTNPGDRVAVIATKPLTSEEGWREFQRGELLMFDHGLPYSDPEMCANVERQGRGLQSKTFRKMGLLASCNISAPTFAT
ncbi:glutamine amidotransferase [Fragilaria crotonensis]|nr:glutamine amidotransferase [Fragilaria crotonensis]